MKVLIRRLRKVIVILLLGCCLSGMTACSTTKNVIIPDSREVKDLSQGSGPMPGWYGISGGYLRELYRDCGDKK